MGCELIQNAHNLAHNHSAMDTINLLCDFFSVILPGYACGSPFSRRKTWAFLRLLLCQAGFLGMLHLEPVAPREAVMPGFGRALGLIVTAFGADDLVS
jgi:hypothetical protein